MWDEAKEKAELELKQLEKLIEINASILKKIASGQPDQPELLALSAILHSFYTGAENIFRRIIIEIDESLPDTPHWHREILDSMADSTSSRKTVISDNLKEQLAEYLAFRHTFRHLYSFDLDWRKMKHLAANLDAVFDQLKNEIMSFFNNS